MPTTAAASILQKKGHFGVRIVTAHIFYYYSEQGQSINFLTSRTHLMSILKFESNGLQIKGHGAAHDRYFQLPEIPYVDKPINTF